MLLALSLLLSTATARFGSPAARTHSTPGSAGPRAAPQPDAFTSTSLWPLPAFDSRASAARWKLVSGPDQAATGPDCPYTGHGPDGSLAACQAACVSAGAAVCTDINFSPTVPDCVYRRCEAPLAPALSSAPGYVVYAVTRPAVPLRPVAPGFAFVAARGAPSSEELSAALARAAAAAFPYGPPAPSSAPPAGAPLLALAVNITDPAPAPLALGVNESYTLTIGAAGAATLDAPTVWGALRGLETFAQLCGWSAGDGSYGVEEAVVRDAPRFAFRGVMVDASRHFLSLSALKRVVEEMAAVKLNALSIHFNDDTSWPLFIPSFPQLSLQGAYSNTSHTYTAPMMAELVAFARLRGVRVIPEFDSPSHFGTLSGAYPELMAVQADGGLCMLDPSREASFDFLAAVWRDIAAMFPDAQFRIGGDEFEGCWSACPAVMAWARKTFGPNATAQDAYHYYIRRQVGIARALGKQTMAWLDVEGFPDKAKGETWAKDCAFGAAGPFAVSRERSVHQRAPHPHPRPHPHTRAHTPRRPRRHIGCLDGLLPGLLASGHCPLRGRGRLRRRVGSVLHH